MGRKLKDEKADKLIASNIYLLRVANGIQLKDMAVILGVSYKTLHSYEAGSTVPVYILIKMCEQFMVNLDYICKKKVILIVKFIDNE